MTIVNYDTPSIFIQMRLLRKATTISAEKTTDTSAKSHQDSNENQHAKFQASALGIAVYNPWNLQPLALAYQWI